MFTLLASLHSTFLLLLVMLFRSYADSSPKFSKLISVSLWDITTFTIHQHLSDSDLDYAGDYQAHFRTVNYPNTDRQGIRRIVSLGNYKKEKSGWELDLFQYVDHINWKLIYVNTSGQTKITKLQKSMKLDSSTLVLPEGDNNFPKVSFNLDYHFTELDVFKFKSLENFNNTSYYIKYTDKLKKQISSLQQSCVERRKQNRINEQRIQNLTDILSNETKQRLLSEIMLRSLRQQQSQQNITNQNLSLQLQLVSRALENQTQQVHDLEHQNYTSSCALDHFDVDLLNKVVIPRLFLLSLSGCAFVIISLIITIVCIIKSNKSSKSAKPASSIYLNSLKPQIQPANKRWKTTATSKQQSQTNDTDSRSRKLSSQLFPETSS